MRDLIAGKVLNILRSAERPTSHTPLGGGPGEGRALVPARRFPLGYAAGYLMKRTLSSDSRELWRSCRCLEKVDKRATLK